VGTLEDVVGRWQAVLPRAQVLPISAIEGTNLPQLLEALKEQLPFGPPLYPNDTLTDKPQRFFASEIIRSVRAALFFVCVRRARSGSAGRQAGKACMC